MAAPKPDQNKGKLTISSPFSVAAFSPSEGAALSALVTVTFNTAELNRNQLSVLTHYNLVCGADTYAAASLDYLTGYSSVTATLQTPPGLVSGSTCTFYVSAELEDLAGNPLGGTRSVTYRVP